MAAPGVSSSGKFSKGGSMSLFGIFISLNPKLGSRFSIGTLKFSINLPNRIEFKISAFKELDLACKNFFN